jgi:hypothetical protein
VALACSDGDTSFDKPVSSSEAPKFLLQKMSILSTGSVLGIDLDGYLPDKNFILALVRAFENNRSTTYYSGISIQNAVFPDGVNLDFTEIDIPIEVRGGCSLSPWTMERAIFKKDVSFSDMSVPNFSAYDASFERDVRLTHLTISGDLLVSNIAVGGALDGSMTTANNIYMDSIQVGGNLTLNGAKAEATLSVANSHIGGDVYIAEAASFGRMALNRSRFGGTAAFPSIEVKGNTSLSGTRFGHNVILGVRIADIPSSADASGRPQSRRSRYGGPIDFDEAVVEGNIILSGTEIYLLDLRGTHATAGLILAGEPGKTMEWTEEYRVAAHGGRVQFSLQDFQTTIIQDGTLDNWPPSIELNNMKFERTTMADGGSGGLLSREPDILPWLRQDPTFDRTTYEGVSAQLRRLGRWDLADEVMTERWQRDRDELASGLRWILLWLAWLTVGFGVGIGYLNVLVCVAILVAAGTFVIRRPGAYDPCPRDGGPSLGPLYCLDRLLPVISLSDINANITLKSRTSRIYFAMHTTLGWILTAFIVAGIGLLSR